MVDDVWIILNEETGIPLWEYGHFHSENAAKFAYFEKTGKSGPNAGIVTLKLSRVGDRELV